MNIIYLFLSGILISIGAVLPGVSGTVIAIMLGIYEKVINVICQKKEFLNKIKLLLPLSLGFIIGIYFFGNLLLDFYNKYEVILKYIFIGLIIGSIPVLTNELKSKNQSINYKMMIISLIISLLFFSLPNFFSKEIFKCDTNYKLILAGFFYAAGKVIPGISSSIFMIAFGLYDSILLFITNPFVFSFKEYIAFFPFILGVVLGVLSLFKIINFCLNNYFSKTYSLIIGFIIGSLITIFPKFSFNILNITSFFLMIIIIVIMFYLNKKNH